MNDNKETCQYCNGSGRIPFMGAGPLLEFNMLCACMEAINLTQNGPIIGPSQLEEVKKITIDDVLKLIDDEFRYLVGLRDDLINKHMNTNIEIYSAQESKIAYAAINLHELKNKILKLMEVEK